MQALTGGMKEAANRHPFFRVVVIKLYCFFRIDNNHFDGLCLQAIDDSPGHLEPLQPAGGQDNHPAAFYYEFLNIALLNTPAVARSMFRPVPRPAAAGP